VTELSWRTSETCDEVMSAYHAALLACEDDAEGEGAIRVTDAHMAGALDQLLDSRSQLTRVLLGGEQPTAPAGKGTLGARP